MYRASPLNGDGLYALKSHPIAGSRGPNDHIDSYKLTWKWRGAPYKTTILYIGPSSFHVSLGEGKPDKDTCSVVWRIVILQISTIDFVCYSVVFLYGTTVET